MKLSDLHQMLSRRQGYRDAYARIGDSVLLAVHFTAARLAARLTRAGLATPLELTSANVTEIEEEFDFSNSMAVSLIADRLEGHLESFGVKSSAFFIPGGRIADVEARKKAPRPITSKASDFEDAGISQSRARLLQEESITPAQLRILRDLATGTTTKRQAVHDLVGLGIIQPRAERLISILEGKA